MGTPVFTKEMTVAQANAAHPAAAYVFASFHLGGCSHCEISKDETIEQVALGYGIPIEMVMDALNALNKPEGESTSA